MSTLDSILHANMTVLTRDVYQRYIAPERSQAHYVLVGRMIVVALLVVGYLLSVKTFGFLVTLVTLSGAGALQLMPAMLGVCFPGGRVLTRTGVLAGLTAGLVTLYLTLVPAPNPLATLVAVPHPYGMHGGIWALLVNAAVAMAVSAVTERPSADTVRRVHGELERFVYGTEE
jgi:SSS family solute:Na+ symporter